MIFVQPSVPNPIVFTIGFHCIQLTTEPTQTLIFCSIISRRSLVLIFCRFRVHMSTPTSQTESLKLAVEMTFLSLWLPDRPRPSQDRGLRLVKSMGISRVGEGLGVYDDLEVPHGHELFQKLLYTITKHVRMLLGTIQHLT